MSGNHKWEVRDISHFPAISGYDLDITEQEFGKLCTCTACGLRVVASESRMPDDVPGMPECRPPTYQTEDQALMERLYISAETAVGALCLKEGTVAPPEVAIALSILSTHVASRFASWAGEIVWSRRYSAALELLLRCVEMTARDVADDADEEWKEWDDHFQPDKILVRFSDMISAAELASTAAEVMES